MNDFKVKKGDTGYVLSATLTQDGSPFSLTGATGVTFYFQRSSDNELANRAGTIVDSPTGKVSYTLVAGDWDYLQVGTFAVEIKAAYAGGLRTTFPTEGYLRLVVEDDLS